jgi:hypothetical protein
MRSRASVFLVALLALAGPAAAEKPTVPVALTLSSRPAADGGTLVALEAVAHRDVPALELALGDERVQFGATRAGERRRIEARIAVPASGIDVTGGARTGTAGRVRTRVTSIRLGPAAPARPFARRTVFGRPVAEVRP